jgi:protease PrsW
MNILLFLIAVIPAILVCFYIFGLKKYENQVKNLSFAFFLGVLLIFPTSRVSAFVKNIFSEWLYGENIQKLGVCIFSIGMVEEFFKMLLVLIFFYSKKYFKSIDDGIVFTLMTALGFATAENLLYASSFGFETAIWRIFSALPLHIFLSIILGFFIGKSKLRNDFFYKIKNLTIGFLIVSFLHGFYDFLAMN